MVGDT
jgi:hypothetical protein